MATQMTRKEYEAKYGVAPVLNTSTFDVSPAPIRMTREEYEQTYNPKEQTRAQKAGSQIKEAFTAGKEKSTKGFEKITEAVGEIKDVKSPQQAKDLYKKVIRGELRFVGGAVDAAFAPLAPIFAPVGTGVGKLADKIGSIPAVQKFASGEKGQERIERTEDVLDLVNISSVVPVGKIASGAASSISKGTPKAIQTAKVALKERAVNKLADEILNIENSYNKTAIKNTLSSDSGKASRQRIANTDVLTGLVDEDGKITFESANNAAESYRKQTIDGAEGVVREILKNEGKTVNAEQLRQILTEEVASSGLQGADLLTAMRGIKNEINGLRIRADEFGNIPLYVIQDSKIGATKYIDYTKPPQVSYRKSLANAYRRTIENLSKANVEVGGKPFSIKQINENLGIYLGDIERIKALGGKKVKGGRLGKYSAQIAGNIAGGAAGGAIGGPLGVAVGTVVGGEVGSKLRGKQMSSTFGKAKGKVAPQNAVIEAARLKAKEGSVMNLKTPDIKVGAPKSIKKTKEVVKLEKQIAKNVDEQKKAIKDGNFTLVATLKEIYAVLVNKLKNLIKEFKEIPNREGGFLNVSGFSKADNQSGKQKLKTSPSSKSTTTSKGSQVASKSDDLIQEAKKYKSAEEFIKAQPKLYHGGTADIKDIQLGKSNFQKTFYMSENPEYAKSYGGNKSSLNEIVIDSKAKLADLRKPSDYLLKQIEDIISPKQTGKTIKIQKPDGTFLEIPETKGGLSNPVHNSKDILNGIKQGKAYFAEMPEVKTALKKLGYDGMITQESSMGANFGVWNKNIIKTKSQLEEIWKKANQTTKEVAYKGEKDLTTKILKDLEGKTTVSKQYILDATNRGELKQVERDLIRDIVSKEGNTVNVADFAKKVKAELLPLKRVTQKSVKYENIDLPDELKMPTDKYEEHIYESPIKTSAGKVHGFNTEYYSGHTRTRDLADKKTRQILEIQDDLRQKGNLEKEVNNYGTDFTKAEARYRENNGIKPDKKLTDLDNERITELVKQNQNVLKLSQYDNRTSPFRMVREEIKKASEDGKTKLQFPTGETAMKIEGLGETSNFFSASNKPGMEGMFDVKLKPESLKVGEEVFGNGDKWIITDVLGDGKFKAVPKSRVESEFPKMSMEAKLKTIKDNPDMFSDYSEQFDISGKIDTNNPIYKFYEKDIQNYLKKFGGQRVKDAQGVEWIEVPVKKEWAKMPVEAFALAPLLLNEKE